MSQNGCDGPNNLPSTKPDSTLIHETLQRSEERPSSSGWQSEGFVNQFREFLATQGKRENTIKQILIFAKKYRYVLETADASALLALSPRNKHHAMASIANLAKFLGR